MPKTETILFTRKRWDQLFAIALVAACIVTVICVFILEHLQYLIVPFAFIGMWLHFRRITPISGELVRTIAGNPSTVCLLIWLTVMLVAMICFLVFDTIVLEHPFNAPLSGYHWICMLVWLAVTTVVGHAIGKGVKQSDR